jgi:GGDEF domain-containing protein
MCTIIDLFRFYLTVNEDYSKFVRVGFFIYLGCTGLSTIFHSAQLQKTNKELEQLAYIDNETGALNRTAFIKYVGESCTPTLALVAIEVLELKEIVESLGALGKSEAIKSAAKMIEFAFCNYGKIFRIAEAKFLVVLEIEIEKSYDHGLEILKKRIHNSNKSRGLKVYLADNYILYEKDGERMLESILAELEYSLPDTKQIKDSTNIV